MNDIFDRILILKNSSIFSQANTEDLLVVAQALDEELYFKNDRIFEIDERGDKMFMIQSGKVGISTRNNGASNDYIAVLSEGECFGEMNLLDDLPRSATAHVLEDTNILALKKEKLRGLIIKYPELSLGIMRSLSIRLRNTTNLLNDG
ncbi:MAG: cyclic nucleotide-binding domain-containing protein [Thioalkalispiraceae bacterium]|jgi:CRP-like cAMP-binding protein